MTVSGLLADGDFAVLDARPRPGLPPVSVLDGLPRRPRCEALWWERHIVEVLRGLPPDAAHGAVPRPEYDPGLVSLTRAGAGQGGGAGRCGQPVTASAVASGGAATRPGPGRDGRPPGRQAHAAARPGRRSAVVEAMRQAISEATDASTRTALFIFWRAGQILAPGTGPGRWSCRHGRRLYRLFSACQAGKHTTGSARTRRSLAARPDGPFSGCSSAAPGRA